MGIRCKLGIHKYSIFTKKKGVGTIEKCERCNTTRTWIALEYILRVKEAKAEILKEE